MDLELKINTLEDKVKKLIEKHNTLKHDYKTLKTALAEQTDSNSKLQSQILALEQEYQSLQIANSILGSDTDKRGAKLKINAIIRDLDLCIAQLSV